jgi:oligopeptide transport system substrate-binding protein
MRHSWTNAIAWHPSPVTWVRAKLGVSARVVAGIFGIALLTACNSDQGQSSSQGLSQHQTSLRRGLGGEPGSLDPAQAVDSFSTDVLDDLYEGLIAESPDGALVPGVAESWTVDASGTQYTFQLRRDAKWSNGTPVTAQAFENAWRRVLDPKSASPVADNLRVIRGADAIIHGRASPETLGVSAPRDDLLIVNLEKPAPYFLQLLTHTSTFPIYSDAAAMSHDTKVWVSDGPYVLSSWIPGGTLHLLKNEHYWNRAKVPIGTVDYIPVSDENAEMTQYRADQLDLTQGVPTAMLAVLRRDRPTEFHSAPFLATAYYAFNLRRGPLRDSVALRQCLAMAIDRKVLLQTLLPYGQQPAYGFLPPGTLNYEPQSWAWKNLSDEARIQEARRLYAGAGYTAKKPLHLTLLFNSNTNIKQLAIAIAAMWKETLGIDTSLVDEEYRVFLQSRKDPSRWDVLRLAWTADYNDAGNFLDTFKTSSPNNDAGYANNQYDALLQEASFTTDTQKRRNLLESAEKLMLSDYPIVPIFFFSSHRLIRPYVKGEIANPLNRLYSKHLAIEPH